MFSKATKLDKGVWSVIQTYYDPLFFKKIIERFEERSQKKIGTLLSSVSTLVDLKDRFGEQKPFHWPSNKLIWLCWISSHIQGFGSAMIWKMIQDSKKAGCPGQIYARATGSFPFYAKMGFIPLNKEEVHRFADVVIEMMRFPSLAEKFESKIHYVDLVLSEEGMHRWLDCVNNEKRFIPFHSLSHLTKHIDESTLEKLLIYENGISSGNLEMKEVFQNCAKEERSYHSIRLG